MKQMILMFVLFLALSAKAQEIVPMGPRFARSRMMPAISKPSAVANAKKKTERLVSPMNALSRDTVGANAMHQLDVTGKDVVLCVVDVGIDFNHEAFSDSTGVSHIKRAMIYPNQENDTLWNDDHSQWRWNYLYARTPEEIAALTTDDENQDHGTHTSNSAGGARHEAGSENAEYYGMAPDADLFLVGNPTLNAEYAIDAFNHAKEYADSIGKPLVCSYSIGDIFLPLDTMEYWPRALREFTQDGNAKGIAVCVSAGNSGSETDKLSLHWNYEDASIPLEHKTVLGYSTIGEDKAYYAKCYYMFYDINGHDLEYQLAITDATTDTLVWQSNKISTADETETDIMQDTPFAKYGSVIVSSGIDNDNHLKCAYVIADNLALPYYVNAEGQPTDTCYVLTIIVDGEVGGHIEGKGYPGSVYGVAFSKGTEYMHGYEEGDALNALNSYCVNPWCISVGASNATAKNGGYAYFSAYGYDYYGNSYPEVLSPGMGIVSAVNRYNTDPQDLSSSPYASISGTSMSTPITAGVIACWMQQNPELTTRQIHEIIAKTSYIDPVLAASAKDPSLYGHGTLQGKAGWDMVKVKYPTSLGNIPALIPPTNDKTYNLYGVEVGAESRGFLIRNGKIIIIK